MARKDIWLQAAAVAAIVAGSVGLEGCQAVREATGAIKQPPDEFTVLTKAPLVIPPDYNLRPPQPGVASRNEIDPDQQAQAALFAPSATEQVASLGTEYSDGEKFLLSKTSALGADPNIRHTVNADAGHEDQGPEFASKVLYEGARPPAPAYAGAAAPVQPTPADSQGFFGRNFGFLGLGSSGEQPQAVEQPQPVMVAQNQPVYAPAPQPVYAPPAQPVQAPQVYAPVPPPVATQAQQVYAPAPQVYAPPPQGYAPAPQGYAPAPQVYAPAPQMAAPQAQPVPQAYAPAPMMAAPPPPPQLAAAPQPVYPQPAAADEQPGWFTRNFVLSPKQREALASGQPIATVAPQFVAQPPQPVPAYAAQQQPVPQYTMGPQPQYAGQPAPQYAAQPYPGQPVPQYAQQQPVYYGPAVAQRKPEAKNLYQYLFTGPQPAPAARPVAVMPQQQQVIQLPPQQPGQPVPQQVQPMPQPQPEKEGWFARNFGL